MAYIYDIADTWSGGGAFTGIKLNVTDGGSTAGSLLMDLQVGGVSQFSVSKTGAVTAGTVFANSVGSSSGGTSILSFGTARFSFGAGGGGANAVGLRSDGQIGWASSTSPAGAADLTLLRDAANTLAQRNGVNAQSFNLYNTYTDASNYERGFMRFVSNVLEIGADNLGTGSTRSVLLRSPTNMFIRSFGNASVLVGGASGDVLTIQTSSPILGLRSTAKLGWTASTTSGNAVLDTALVRESAAVVKVTDGSTGTGQLIFIVPTTNPGITGALWNNAGTLAISA